MKNAWKLLRLCMDPKLTMYINGFRKSNDPEKIKYFKTMYKVRYDELIRKMNKKG